MEIGIYTFAERTADPRTGYLVSAQQRFHDLLEEIVLADELGLDVFGVGEHHRPDYLASSPAVVLAAAASRTRRIRLTSAVTVLSSDDPVRVFQDFATLDLLSGGRAEIMAGRGSFIESFPLFGYRPRGLRCPVRREARLTAGPARTRTRDLVRNPSPAARRSWRLSASRARQAARVDCRGRDAGVGRAGGNARAADGAGHHRRTARAIRAPDRAVSRNRPPCRARPGDCCR